jgi:hypothetical protein
VVLNHDWNKKQCLFFFFFFLIMVNGSCVNHNPRFWASKTDSHKMGKWWLDNFS